MQLILGTPSVTPGPDWAQLINDALTKVDQHTHATNSGAKVTPAGINITANLPCNNYSFTDLNSTTYRPQSSALTVPASIHNVAGDLYWVAPNGASVQITSGTGLNLASIGTIGGDFGQSGVTAAVTYSDALKTFSFTQASGITAKMFFGDILLTPTSAGQNSVTIKAPTGCSAWSFTIPGTAQTVGTTQAALTTNTSGVASHVAIATANTATAIVQRDASGNFSAGTITATFSGNITGNVTGNVSGSSGSSTGNSATATLAATATNALACSGNSATATLAATATNALACSGNAATATLAATATNALACSGNSATATTATNQSGGTVNATTVTCTSINFGGGQVKQKVLTGTTNGSGIATIPFASILVTPQNVIGLQMLVFTSTLLCRNLGTVELQYDSTGGFTSTNTGYPSKDFKVIITYT
jgi:hypothetical protein